MCDHCGCRGVGPIRELLDEHAALSDQSHDVRRMFGSGDPHEATTLLGDLVSRLQRHVRREEDGIFRALRDSGEFLDEVDSLEREHDGFEKAVAALDPGAGDFPAAVTALLDELAAHIEREDYGIFPVAVVTLGASGWKVVDDAHSATPSFLLDQVEQLPAD